MSNIINSLKRLERVGSETSITTRKLQMACEEIAKKIEENILPLIGECVDPQLIKITDNLYVAKCGDSGSLIFDYGGCADVINHQEYILYQSARYVSRRTALAFAQAISENDLLEKVTDWIENRKNEMEKAIKILESKGGEK